MSCLGLLLLLGCGPAPAPPAPKPSPISEVAIGDLALGTGTRSFVPLHEGDEVKMVAGPQGGFHVFIALRARGIEPDNTRVRLGYYGLDGAELLVNQYRASFTPTGDLLQTLGLVHVLPPEPDLTNQQVVIRAEVVDAAGLTLANSARVKVLPP